MYREQLNNFIAARGQELYSFCCYLTKKQQEADELYQETFVYALTHPPERMSDASSEAYDQIKKLLLSAAVRLWKDKKRTYARRRRITQEAYLPYAMAVYAERTEQHPPEEVLIRQETLTFVRKCVNELPENLKTAVLLYYMEELSIPEIASVLKIPAGTVKSRLFRARKVLEEELSHE